MQLGKDFNKALKQIEQEKGLSPEIIISSLEAALISSYRKHRGGNQNVEVHIEPENGEIVLYEVKQVSGEVTEMCVPASRASSFTAVRTTSMSSSRREGRGWRLV